MNREQSDFLSIAAQRVYWRTITRLEYRKAFGIARRLFLSCGKSFPVGSRASCPLLSMRYYRGKTTASAKLQYGLSRNKLSRLVNLP
jgi:hypothetical protein